MDKNRRTRHPISMKVSHRQRHRSIKTTTQQLKKLNLHNRFPKTTRTQHNWRIGERERNPKNEYISLCTFMLDGLTLALWGAFGDGATHEDDELLDAGALEVPEVAHVQSVRQNHRIRTLTGAFQHQQSCDLHISLSLLSFYNSTSLSLSLTSFKSSCASRALFGFGVGNRWKLERARGNGI